MRLRCCGSPSVIALLIASRSTAGRRLPHAPFVPRRLRVPLVKEAHPDGPWITVGLSVQARRALDPRRARRGSSRRCRPRRASAPRAASLRPGSPEHQALHVGGLAPVALERLHHQLDARVERDEPVGPGADRRLLETVVAHVFDILLRHDPPAPVALPRRSGSRARRLEPEAHAARIGVSTAATRP